MRLSDQKDKSDWVQILPMTLVPSKVPERLFKQAYKVQKVSVANKNCLLFV